MSIPPDGYRLEDFDELFASIGDEDDAAPANGHRVTAPGPGRIPVTPGGDLARVVQGCDFLRWCRDHQADVSEPLWYALLSNLARLDGGREAAHEFSKGYPGYSARETDAKLDHAQRGSLPITCARIRELGFDGCPPDGHGVASPAALGLSAPSPPPPGAAAEPFAEGLGAFLARTFPSPDPFIDGLLSDDGGGWLGGEEKLGKTYWALDEALALALGQKVAGLFGVPARRRVLFLEEEDPPRRTHRRLRALLRGRGLDPDDPAVRADLDAWFRLAVWQGFTFDVPDMIRRLDDELRAFAPAVVYIDVLRKVTLKDLNKAAEAGALLALLDERRRRHGVLFRILHHYRKLQGSHRAGRGSQEIGGSFALGAWAENSLFFEPVGRQQGGVRVSVQSKDAPPVAAFIARLESEGPRYDPTLVRVVATEEKPEAATAELDDAVAQTIAASPIQVGMSGTGVSVKAVAEALKRPKRTVQRAVDRLLDAGRIRVTGSTSRSAKLYGVKANETN